MNRAFLEIDRQDRAYRPVAERLRDWDEFVEPLPGAELRVQAERCMDCGVPFCHTGCPVNNLIPDWNDLVTKGQWRAALDRLHRIRGAGLRLRCRARCRASARRSVRMIRFGDR